MARFKRYRPKKENVIKGTPYDSLLEKNLHEGKLSTCRFHDKNDKVKYIVPHTYEPDFCTEVEEKTYLIESKGRFQTSAEASKYIHIRSVLDEEKQELVFLWDKKGTFMPGSRKRKDGTRATNEEWAEKHGFRHWHKDEFELDLL